MELRWNTTELNKKSDRMVETDCESAPKEERASDGGGDEPAQGEGSAVWPNIEG